MPDVFLSYSRKDVDYMHRLRDDLVGAGLDVWTDESGLEPGSRRWTSLIEEALEQAQCMVVVLSPDAKESQWVGLYSLSGRL